MGSRRVHVQYPMGTPQCARTASAVAGWPRLPRPAQQNGVSKLQSPARRFGKKGRGDRRVHGGVQPAVRHSVLRIAWQRSCLVCNRRRLSWVHKGTCIRAFRAATVALCRAATSDGVRRGGGPRRQWRSPAPAKGKTSRQTHQTMDWWRVADDGGWGARAAGRTSTGATCAISASRRGSSGAQCSSLHSQ